MEYNQTGDKKMWNDNPIVLTCNIKRYKKIMTVAELMNFNEETGEFSYKVDTNTGKASTIINGEHVIINPDHQRSYVWKDDVKTRFIESMIKGRDCNTITIAEFEDCGEEHEQGKHCLNGQQRLRTIGEFLRGQVTLNLLNYGITNVESLKKINCGLYFRNFLKTEIVVQFIKGNHEEIMEEWKACNVPAEKHTNQEIRNGVYPGEWNNWMRSNFSYENANGCSMVRGLGCGAIERQKTMETCICWVAAGAERSLNKQNELIDAFMFQRKRKDDKNYCETFYNEFYKIHRWISAWTRTLKTAHYKKVREIGRKWGVLYHTYKDLEIPSDEVIKKFVDSEIVRIGKLKEGKFLSAEDKEKAKDEKLSNVMESLMVHLRGDNYSTNNKGEKFTRDTKNAVWFINGGICARCGKPIIAGTEHYHHLLPLSMGGSGNIENCVLLHDTCHNHATGDYDLFNKNSFPYAKNLD